MKFLKILPHTFVTVLFLVVGVVFAKLVPLGSILHRFSSHLWINCVTLYSHDTQKDQRSRGKVHQEVRAKEKVTELR